MSKISITNCTAQGNAGHGLHISGNVDAQIDNFKSINNVGNGIYVEDVEISNLHTLSGLFKKLGLSDKYSTNDLANDLRILKNESLDKRKEIIESEKFKKKFGNLVLDFSTFAANMITIVSSEHFSKIMHLLH